MPTYILCGSYSGRLFALSLNRSTAADSGDDPAYSLQPSFSDSPYSVSVRFISASDRYALLCSADEKLTLYDLRRRRDLGTAIHFAGDISGAAFLDQHHVVTASSGSHGEDGMLNFYNARDDFALVLSKVAHRKGIKLLSAHPSGKLVFTLGRDFVIKAWETSKATCVSGISVSPSIFAQAWELSFTADGSLFFVPVGREIHVFSVETGAKEQAVFQRPAGEGAKISCTAPISGTRILVGDDAGIIEEWDLSLVQSAAESAERSRCIPPHVVRSWKNEQVASRIKGLSLVVPSPGSDGNTASARDGPRQLLVGACSDGTVFAYCMSSGAMLACMRIEARITSVAVCQVEETATAAESRQKREREADSDEQAEEAAADVEAGEERGAPRIRGRSGLSDADRAALTSLLASKKRVRVRIRERKTKTNAVSKAEDTANGKQRNGAEEPHRDMKAGAGKREDRVSQQQKKKVTGATAVRK